VTIRDPKAIDPRESVEARPKALRFGCLGWNRHISITNEAKSRTLPSVLVLEARSNTNLRCVYETMESIELPNYAHTRTLLQQEWLGRHYQWLEMSRGTRILHRILGLPQCSQNKTFRCHNLCGRLNLIKLTSNANLLGLPGVHFVYLEKG
jgi:hypothetical protein